MSGPEAPASPRDCPYFGLNFYTEKDGRWLFGREAERTKLITNLRGARLTLLHAESGVGKSSLLRAGVAWRLSELAEDDDDVRDVPVVFSSWTDDPLPKLIATIEEAVAPLVDNGAELALPRDDLRGAIQLAAREAKVRLLVILDQFEEYFRYGSGDEGSERFADQLARCINEFDLPANFLIAIREEAYAELGDLLKGRIANVYGNYLHLEYLSRANAEAAIRGPLKLWEAQHGVKVEVDPELVRKVLGKVKRRVETDAPDTGDTDDKGDGDPRGKRPVETDIPDAADSDGKGDGDPGVSTPLLQLVMEAVWKREQVRWQKEPTNGVRQLRLSTLEEELKGVESILDRHLENALAKLDEEESETAIDMFDRLVTESGSKIAQAAPELAHRTGHSEGLVKRVLDKLVAQRILSVVEAPPGRDARWQRYEIAHDVLGPPIIRAVSARDEKRAQREAQTERDRAQRLRRLVVAIALLAALAVSGVVVAYFAKRHADAQTRTAQSRQLAASAIDHLESDPTLSALLALEALHKSPTVEAEHALRASVPLLQLQRTLKSAASVTSAAYSPDGKLVVTAQSNGVARIWDAGSHSQVGTSLGQPGPALNSAVFSPDGKLVATAGDEGVARLWSVDTHKQVGAPIAVNEHFETRLLSVAFRPDGRWLVTASEDGTARIWDAQRASHPELGVAGKAGASEPLIADAQFSPDGSLIVTAAGDVARIWSTGGGRQKQLVSGGELREPDGEAMSTATFSPGDGRSLITTSYDGKALVWPLQPDGAAKSSPTTLAPQSFVPLTGAAFSRDSKLIVTASNDGTARIFSVQTDREVGRLTSANHAALNTAVFAPDGKHVLTASTDGTAKIWDKSRPHRPGDVLAAGDLDPLNRSSFSPHGKLVAAAGRDGTATVWDAATGRTRATVGQPGHSALNDVLFLPQEPNLILTGSKDGQVNLWNTDNGAHLTLAEARHSVSAVALSHDSGRFAVAAGDEAQVFDLAERRNGSSRVLAQIHQPKITDVAFDPQRRNLVVTASANGEARIWDGRRPIGKIKEPEGEPIETARFSEYGELIVTASDDGTARVWNVFNQHQEGEPLTEPGHAILRDAEFSPDDSRILTVSTDGVARIWDRYTQRLLMSLAGHSGRIISGAFVSNDVVETSSSDGTLKLWKAFPSEQSRQMLMAPFVAGVAFGPEGKVIATAGYDGVAHLWDATTHSEVGRPMRVSSRDAFTSVAFSPDGTRLVTGGQDGFIRTWDVRTAAHPEVGRDRIEEPGPVRSVAFSRDGRLVTSSDDGIARVWKGREEVAKISDADYTALRDASFSPDGGRIVTASEEGTARIWTVASGESSAQVALLEEPGGDAMNSAQFSPDGRLVVTTSNDGTARVWDAKTGEQVQVLSQPGHGVMTWAEFDATGSKVLTANGDGRARIWAVPPNERRASAASATQSSGGVLTEFPVGDYVYDARFAPDGKTIVTATALGAQVWSTTLAGPLPAIEDLARERLERLHRRLTASERAAVGLG